MDYCQCGIQATAQCTQCSKVVCRAHADSSRTRAGDLLAGYQRLTGGAAQLGHEPKVLCPDCRKRMARQTLLAFAEQLRSEGQTRGTTWLLALGLWSERQDTDDATYARIVCENLGWDAHVGTGPFDVALACFRSLGSAVTANRMTVTFAYRTERRQTLFQTKKSERKEEIVGQLGGWIVRYAESSDEYAPMGTFFLDLHGQVYPNPGLMEIDPGNAKYAIPYQHKYAEAAGSRRKDVADARSRLARWLAGVDAGHTGQLAAFHCDRCAEAAAVRVARIAVGLR